MQSSDRLLGHRVDSGQLSAPKRRQERGEEEDGAVVSTDRYAAVSFWSSLPGRIAANGLFSDGPVAASYAVSTAARFNCYCVPACFCVRVHLCIYTCATHMFSLCVLNESLAQYSTLSFMSFANLDAMERLCSLIQLLCWHSASKGFYFFQRAMRFFP